MSTGLEAGLRNQAEWYHKPPGQEFAQKRIHYVANSKSEYRNSKQIRNLKSECSKLIIPSLHDCTEASSRVVAHDGEVHPFWLQGSSNSVSTVLSFVFW